MNNAFIINNIYSWLTQNKKALSQEAKRTEGKNKKQVSQLSY